MDKLSIQHYSYIAVTNWGAPEQTPPYEVNSEICPACLIACLIHHHYMAKSGLSANQNYIKHVSGLLSINQYTIIRGNVSSKQEDRFHC